MVLGMVYEFLWGAVRVVTLGVLLSLLNITSLSGSIIIAVLLFLVGPLTPAISGYLWRKTPLGLLGLQLGYQITELVLAALILVLL